MRAALIALLRKHQWDKRSKRAGRAYVYELGKQAGLDAARRSPAPEHEP